MSKYGVISVPYFLVFTPNTGKYGPEITPYLDNFHAVVIFQFYQYQVLKQHGVYNFRLDKSLLQNIQAVENAILLIFEFLFSNIRMTFTKKTICH